jgi:hypothetical protein
VHCSLAFRSSVPSSIPPQKHGPGGRRAFASLAMQWRSSSGVWGSVPAGEGSFAQVIMAGFLTLAQAALTALGPVRRNSGVDNF